MQAVLEKPIHALTIAYVDLCASTNSVACVVVERTFFYRFEGAQQSKATQANRIAVAVLEPLRFWIEKSRALDELCQRLFDARRVAAALAIEVRLCFCDCAQLTCVLVACRVQKRMPPICHPLLEATKVALKLVNKRAKKKNLAFVHCLHLVEKRKMDAETAVRKHERCISREYALFNDSRGREFKVCFLVLCAFAC